jgi:hypothetical protein
VKIKVKKYVNHLAYLLLILDKFLIVTLVPLITENPVLAFTILAIASAFYLPSIIVMFTGAFPLFVEPLQVDAGIYLQKGHDRFLPYPHLMRCHLLERLHNTRSYSKVVYESNRGFIAHI